MLNRSIEKDENRRRIELLFSQLDSNKVGFIDPKSIKDKLHEITHRATIPHTIASNDIFVNELAKASDGHKVTYQEFEEFILKKETDLLLLFKDIDVNNDGRIHLADLMNSVKRAGIEISPNEVKQFLDALDDDNDGFVEFKDWRVGLTDIRISCFCIQTNRHSKMCSDTFNLSTTTPTRK
jgi:solute carrier family 25 (mitochondrial phosphate transporter), member 23/24/25/41